MASALIFIVCIFGLLFLLRLAGIWRSALAPHWPALALGGVAAFLVFRGSFSSALLFASLAVLAWRVAPIFLMRVKPAAADPGDAEARRILGIGASASEAEIRAAYREKMARAHPDRGGSHDRAARLTAARDRLLRKRS